jgi:hypothetical protein
MAGGLSYNPVLEEEATTTSISQGLDSVKGVWRWSTISSRDGGWKVGVRVE